MSNEKMSALTSTLEPGQARIMLAILVNLYGERVENCVRPDEVVVTVSKEQFESLPEHSHLSMTADYDTGVITVKLEEVSGDE